MTDKPKRPVADLLRAILTAERWRNVRCLFKKKGGRVSKSFDFTHIATKLAARDKAVDQDNGG